VQLNGR